MCLHFEIYKCTNGMEKYLARLQYSTKWFSSLLEIIDAYFLIPSNHTRNILVIIISSFCHYFKLFFWYFLHDSLSRSSGHVCSGNLQCDGVDHHWWWCTQLPLILRWPTAKGNSLVSALVPLQVTVSLWSCVWCTLPLLHLETIIELTFTSLLYLLVQPTYQSTFSP